MDKIIEISSIEQFVEKINLLTEEAYTKSFVFRGQSNSSWSVDSGAYRRLLFTIPDNYITADNIISYHEKLLYDARLRSTSHPIIDSMSDLSLLSEIQHFGGATLLIDFTYNALTALYFSCENSSDDGKIFCLNFDDTTKFFRITDEEERLTIREIINECTTRDEAQNSPTFWKWLPPHKNNRIIKQDSVFIFNALGKIKDDEFNTIFLIKKKNKKNILNKLVNGFSISEESLYPDFFGFVQVNTSAKIFEMFDSELYFKIGLEHQQKKEYDRAIEYYTKSIKINKRKYSAFNNLGNAYLSMKEYAKAIEIFNEVVNVKPDYYLAWNNLGLTYRDIGNYDMAIKSHKSAVEHNPEFYRAWNNLGFAYNAKGDYDNAISSYQKATELNKEYTTAWLNMGVSHYNQKNYEQALSCYKKVLELEPTNFYAYNNIGLIHSDQKDDKLAIEFYNKAIDIKPDYSQVWNNLGVSYKNLEDFDQAITCYKKAIEHDEANNKAYVNWGRACFLKNEVKESIKYFDKALTIRPNDFFAFNNLALSYIKLYDYNKVVECYRKMVEIAPNASLYATLGFRLLTFGIIDDAEEFLLKSLELGLLDYANMNLGHVYLAKKDTRKALDHYKMSLENFKDKELFWKGLNDDFQYLTQYGITKEIYKTITGEITEISNHP